MGVENVVISNQVIESCPFGRLGKVPNDRRIGSDLGLRKGHFEFHRRYAALYTKQLPC